MVAVYIGCTVGRSLPRGILLIRMPSILKLQSTFVVVARLTLPQVSRSTRVVVSQWPIYTRLSWPSAFDKERVTKSYRIDFGRFSRITRRLHFIFNKFHNLLQFIFLRSF